MWAIELPSAIEVKDNLKDSWISVKEEIFGSSWGLVKLEQSSVSSERTD
jgi:hypothetical protein